MSWEIKTTKFWRSIFAEYLATLLFLLNCSVTLTFSAQPTITQISLGFGLSIAVLVQIFGPASGAHINPAVTVGLAVSRRITIARAIFYIIFQSVGGITGAAICYAVTPASKRGTLGNLALGNDVTQYQGLAVETTLTFLLLMTILAATDPSKEDKTFGPALSIGLAVTACHLIGIPYTGAAMNPARSFGPAVVMNIWPHYHWIYWAGPILGAVLAGTLYKLVFEEHVEMTPKVNEKRDSHIMENVSTNDKENLQPDTVIVTGL